MRRAPVPRPDPGWARRLRAGLATLGILAGCAGPGAPPAPEPFSPVVPDACRDPLNPTFIARECR